VPGRFDQQSSNVPVAGTGDPAAPLTHAAAVLAWDQAEIGHQLAWMREAPRIVDLGNQREGGDGVDAVEAT
jgi:hypothetical protein